MSDEVSHLTAGAVDLLGATVERCIRAIRSRRWVLYPRAKQALDRLSRLLDVPPRNSDAFCCDLRRQRFGDMMPISVYH